jgi:hypothetical protein
LIRYLVEASLADVLPGVQTTTTTSKLRTILSTFNLKIPGIYSLSDPDLVTQDPIAVSVDDGKNEEY